MVETPTSEIPTRGNLRRIAGDARKALEIRTGEKIVSKDNYLPEGKKTKQLNKGKK